jgi:hypothetical protein
VIEFIFDASIKAPTVIYMNENNYENPSFNFIEVDSGDAIYGDIWSHEGHSMHVIINDPSGAYFNKKLKLEIKNEQKNINTLKRDIQEMVNDIEMDVIYFI